MEDKEGKERSLTKFDGFIFDLDGVIYRGNQPIEGARTCINLLHKSDKQYVFVTNHTKYTQKEIGARLRDMGIPVRDNQIITANNAAIDYMREQMAEEKIKVNLLGSGGIREDFENAGFAFTADRPDFVVIAWDPEFTYETMYRAVRNVQEGANFIVTSPDRLIPSSEREFELGFGALGALIQYATQKVPVYVGKPHPPMLNAACQIMNTEIKDTVVVGDTPETDLRSRTLAGLGASVLVLSGNTSREDIASIPENARPTFVLDSIREFDKYF